MARPLVPTSDGLVAVTYLKAVRGVDLWRIDLDHDDPGAAKIIAQPEQSRAAQFVFERDRHRFVVGRAALRRILTIYTRVSPEALRFTKGEHGKPCLAGGPPFSFSNSQGSGLCGVGTQHDIGVDLERLREIPDAAGVAECAFTPDERASWLAAGGDSAAAFLRVWTRKEAALKALGVGLGAESPAALPRRGQRVDIIDVDFDADHLAALAILLPAEGG